MIRCYLTMRADEGPVGYESKAAAMAVVRHRLGGRIYRSEVYTVVHCDVAWSAVSLYASPSEMHADLDGAHAPRLEYYR